MANWKKNARTTLAGLMMAGMASGVSQAYPEGGDKPKNDLGAMLEKVPPEVREKVKAEFERIRAEAEKVQHQAMEAQKQARQHLEQFEKDAKAQAERIQRNAKAEVERIQRDAREQIERVQNEVRRAMEAREREHNAGRPVESQKLADFEKGEGRQRQEVRREMRVEVRKEGDGEPQVRVFENGKPLPPDAAHGRVNMQFKAPEIDLSKLPPEKREAIEKARKEFKEAEARFDEANKKLAKAEGREPRAIVIGEGQFIGKPVEIINIPGHDGQARIEVRGFAVGDRLPGMPLPPGAVVRGDRLPRPPVPPAAPANPELEKRVSKAEKALDDILNELKKLREEEGDEDDDDDKKENHRDKGRKGGK